MLVETGCADPVARIEIDAGRCTVCGLCTKVCKGAPLYLENNRICVDYTRFFGCFACGHCVAVCPQGAITVTGRDFSPADILPMPEREALCDYDHLRSLMISRRSIREFLQRPVERGVIDKILEAAATAPMGIPPSNVRVLVFDGPEKVQAFAQDVSGIFKRSRRMLSPFMLRLMRPFIGKENYDMMKTFVAPLVAFLTQTRDAGEDWLFYNAPLAMHFYASSFADPADPLIAATYATLAAESLGLGSCMIGSVAPFLQRAKPMLRKYGIPQKHQPGIVVIFGYPAARFQHVLKRRFAEIHFS